MWLPPHIAVAQLCPLEVAIFFPIYADMCDSGDVIPRRTFLLDLVLHHTEVESVAPYKIAGAMIILGTFCIIILRDWCMLNKARRSAKM